MSVVGLWPAYHVTCTLQRCAPAVLQPRRLPPFASSLPGWRASLVVLARNVAGNKGQPRQVCTVHLLRAYRRRSREQGLLVRMILHGESETPPLSHKFLFLFLFYFFFFFFFFFFFSFFFSFFLSFFLFHFSSFSFHVVRS